MLTTILCSPTYSDFFPVILNFLRQLPFIGTFLNAPGVREVRRSCSRDLVGQVAHSRLHSITGPGQAGWIKGIGGIEAGTKHTKEILEGRITGSSSLYHSVPFSLNTVPSAQTMPTVYLRPTCLAATPLPDLTVQPWTSGGP